MIDRSLFPSLDHCLYMNHAGVSPLPKAAANMMALYGKECSELGAGAFSKWHPRLTEARKNAAELINAAPEEIAFIKSTTLGLNTIAYGMKWKAGDVIVAEQNTFPANWMPWETAAAEFGVQLWTWPQRVGGYRIDELEARLAQGGVRMVAATSANFTNGWRQDLPAIGEICERHGAMLCVDAIQTLGAFPMDVQAWNIDFLSADSHKWLLGPEGAGFMYVRQDRLPLFKDSVVGWLGKSDFLEFKISDAPPDPTARRFEEGAPNNAGVMAMGESLKLFLEIGMNPIAGQILLLTDHLAEGLRNRDWRIISKRGCKHSSGILAVQKPGIDNGKLVDWLWKEKKILAANRGGNLRLSPHFYLSVEDMDHALTAISEGETFAKVD